MIKHTVAAVGIALWFVAVQEISAQGTIYLSNLSEPSFLYSVSISSNGLVAQRFITGENPEGYVLNSVQLLMDATVGMADGFFVSIYGTNRIGMPNERAIIANLSGPAPSVAGVYTFGASGVTLKASTTYFIVVGATSPQEIGFYRWRIADSRSYHSVGGWQMSLNQYVSDTARLNWVSVGNRPFQFSLNATAIPEPSALVLVFLGTVVLIYGYRKRQMHLSA